MQVVILCGGMGTRLGALARDLPKSLVCVAGRPFIEHQLGLLRAQGLKNILLCAGFKADMIRAHLGAGAGFGVCLRYSLERESCLYGTGGALVNALPQLEENFLLLYGDSYLPTDYRKFARAFVSSKLTAMMSVFHNKGRWDASNVKINDGRVCRYSKACAQGEAEYIDYGLGAFRRETIERYATHLMPFDLTKIYGDLVALNALGAYEVKERFYEIGKPEGLRDLDKHLRGMNGKGVS